MTITLEIPDELAAPFGNSQGEVAKHTLEALVLEAYREERIGAPQAVAVLGISRLQWNRLLKERNVLEHAYSVADLERDVATIHRLRSEGVLPAA